MPIYQVPMEVTVMRVFTVEADNEADAAVKAMAMDCVDEGPDLDVRDWDIDGPINELKLEG